MKEAAPLSRASLVFIFLAAFTAYAWFHQGGGWNQNTRFAMVRAMAEERVFTIDDFLVYSAQGGNAVLSRAQVRNGDFTASDGPKRLAWTGHQWDLHPVNGLDLAPDDARKPLSLEVNAASGDVAFFDGHFHPNKPPGTSFLALPAYCPAPRRRKCGGAEPG